MIETMESRVYTRVQERLLASMLTHQLVADMKRDSASKRLPLAVCASRNGGPQTYDCARSVVLLHAHFILICGLLHRRRHYAVYSAHPSVK